ncbi:MAG: hypothetical protein ACXW27_17470 [Allosphingosinicella sp.]
MASKNRATFLVLSLLLGGCVTCPVVSDGVIQSPCCESVGAANMVNIDTGIAPWQVSGPNLTGFQPVVVPAANVAWAPVPPASWVRPPPPGFYYAVGAYTYAVRFHVPRCSQGKPVIVEGRFAADNAASVFLDTGSTQSTTPVAQGPSPSGFLPASVTPFTATIGSATPGLHTLRVVVTNISVGGGNDSGLVVQARIRTVCAGDPGTSS